MDRGHGLINEATTHLTAMAFHVATASEWLE
jgi:hypothetical protein